MFIVINVKTSKPQYKLDKLPEGGDIYLLINVNGSRYKRMKCRFTGTKKMPSISDVGILTVASGMNGC